MRGPSWNEKTIKRFEAEGRGQGSGANYKPWITVADFSSLGRSHRPWSSKTGRHHELFSDVEYDLFVCLEWPLDVVDIREQHPLDRPSTLQIAQNLGIRHPYYPNTTVPTVMTVDFLVTHLRNGQRSLVAYNAKRDDAAEDEREMLKLEIQRVYHELAEIPHYLVFDSLIPKQKATNIKRIRDAALKPGEIEPYPNYFGGLMDRMAGELAHAPARTPLHTYCSSFDDRHGAITGTGLRVARMLMEERILLPDLNAPDLESAPLDAFRLTGAPGHLRVMGGQ